MKSITQQEAIIAGATPGPWSAEYATGDSMLRLRPHSAVHLNSSGAWAVGPETRTTAKGMKDAEFIAESRTVYPELLAWAKRAKGWLEKMLEDSASGSSRERCLNKLLEELPE